MKLFVASADNYETKEILNLQSRFREWSEMNRIEKELEVICTRKNEHKPKDTLIETINISPTIKTEGNISDN